jgi:hypothetical protein
MSVSEAPHITQAKLIQKVALLYRCPFCKADPGESCRTRTTGQEVWVHSRRIAVSPAGKERRRPKQAKALCCVCGNLRTVSFDYSRRQDPNHSDSPRGKAEGWLRTESLKCDECGERTRHAVLRPSDDRFRDWDERQQLIALGDPDTHKYPMSDEAIAQLRREYREMFPRNPYLTHRYWTKEAMEAWSAGHKKVTALCGEQITLTTDPSQPSKKEAMGHLVADQLSETEYEDPETGLWWIDMDCVDCCRVSIRPLWEGGPLVGAYLSTSAKMVATLFTVKREKTLGGMFPREGRISNAAPWGGNRCAGSNTCPDLKSRRVGGLLSRRRESDHFVEVDKMILSSQVVGVGKLGVRSVVTSTTVGPA